MRSLTAAISIAVCAALFAAFTPARLVAQDPETPSAAAAGTLQAEALRRFRDIHERMQRLQLVKAEREPEEAKTLADGNRFIQERALTDAMDEVSKLIEGQRYDEALERMDRVQTDLTALLELLLNRERDLEAKLQEIKRLEDYKKRVEELLDQQRQQKDAAARSEELQKQLEAAEAAKAELDQLLADQQALRDAAAKPATDAAAMEQMAKRQEDLKARAENLVPKLKELEKKSDDAGAKKPGESKPSEPKDGKPNAGKPGGGSCAGSCQSAAGKMGEAGQQMQKKAPQRAVEDMDAAAKKLQEARDQLEKLAEEAKRKLMQLPFDQQAKAQEKTRIDTDHVAEEMEADDRKADEEGKPQQTPGKRNIQQAVPKQKAAAGSLKEYKPGDAKQEQQDATEELEQAKKALEDALAQIRQELADEVLRAMEERFGEMLERQRELSARTKAADKLAQESLTAADRVPAAVARRAAEIAVGERELAAEASDALKLLAEEGTTAAFPAVVEMLHDDFVAVSERLEANRVAAVTQDLQAEIEQTLKDLIDALRRQIELNEGSGQCAQCNGQPVLVPRSAELKLVMIKQKRVNKRTKAYDEAVPADQRGSETSKEAADELARQQATVEELLRKMAVQLSKDEQARRN